MSIVRLENDAIKFKSFAWLNMSMLSTQHQNIWQKFQNKLATVHITIKRNTNRWYFVDLVYVTIKYPLRCNTFISLLTFEIDCDSMLKQLTVIKAVSVLLSGCRVYIWSQGAQNSFRRLRACVLRKSKAQRGIFVRKYGTWISLVGVDFESWGLNFVQLSIENIRLCIVMFIGNT